MTKRLLAIFVTIILIIACAPISMVASAAADPGIYANGARYAGPDTTMPYFPAPANCPEVAEKSGTASNLSVVVPIDAKYICFQWWDYGEPLAQGSNVMLGRTDYSANGNGPVYTVSNSEGYTDQVLGAGNGVMGMLNHVIVKADDTFSQVSGQTFNIKRTRYDRQNQQRTYNIKFNIIWAAPQYQQPAGPGAYNCWI